MGLHTCTAVARSLCVSWAFLYESCTAWQKWHRLKTTHIKLVRKLVFSLFEVAITSLMDHGNRLLPLKSQPRTMPSVSSNWLMNGRVTCVKAKFDAIWSGRERFTACRCGLSVCLRASLGPVRSEETVARHAVTVKKNLLPPWMLSHGTVQLVL